MLLPFQIVFHDVVVIAAINLDNQHLLRAGKVHDPRFNRMLASKFQTAQLFRSQHTPQQALGNRLCFAQRSCSLNRLRDLADVPSWATPKILRLMNAIINQFSAAATRPLHIDTECLWGEYESGKRRIGLLHWPPDAISNRMPAPYPGQRGFFDAQSNISIRARSVASRRFN